MAKQTVADFLVHRLQAWGVNRIYGYPGDGINGIMGALERVGDAMHFVQVRHEEMAAFMACAHAKFTGEPAHQPVNAVAGKTENAAHAPVGHALPEKVGDVHGFTCRPFFLRGGFATPLGR